MRTFVLTVATVVGILLLPAAPTGIAPSMSMGNGTVSLAAHSLEAQQAPVINVEINKGGGTKAWYANPVWIAIGGLALLVLIVLVVMAFKGGGTTIVKA